MSSQAAILKLPDELLDAIIHHAHALPLRSVHPGMRHYWRKHEDFYRTLFSLSLVCRRFYLITTPHLYADLEVYTYQYTYEPKNTPGPEGLHRSCTENVSLRPLCRRLSVQLSDSAVDSGNQRTSPRSDMATDLTRWFTGTQWLAVSGLSRNEHAWSLVQFGLANFPNLSRLYLEAGAMAGLSLPRVFQTLYSSRINALELHEVSTKGDSVDWRQMEERAGTAAFTTLRLTAFLQTPEVLAHLLRWPAKLEEFSLDFTYGSAYSELGLYDDWSLATLQPILAIHKNTLRSINVTHVNRQGLTGFDLRGFPVLEEISLSSTASMDTEKGWRCYSFEDHLLANIQPPSLRVFHWDLAFEDQQHQEGLSDFGRKEEDWLRAYGHAAIRRKCPLREIRITYSPASYEGRCDTDIYPWDRMDALDEELKPNGIRVVKTATWTDGAT
ncbi:hypothetical protein BJX99DRAFT_263360 [Aspergillus californicus]